MNWDPVQWLKTQHTRELMGLRKSIYRCKGSYDVSDNHQGMTVTLEQLKAELATREHIPNKKEGKAIRRAKAQGKTHLL